MTAYERYWNERTSATRERMRRRSLQRARIALGMLGARGGSLLDVGCGPGYAAEMMASRGFVVTGFEASPSAAAEARARGIAVVEGDIEAGVLPAGPFDVVVAFEVLEHLAEPQPAFAAMLRACKPGGEVVVSLPNEGHALRRGAILLGAEPFGGADDPHVRHFGLKSARRFLDAAGADVHATRAASIVPPGIAAFDALGAALARIAPRLFGLSFLFLVRAPGGAGGRSSGEDTGAR